MMKSSHYRIERRLLMINICNIWLLFRLYKFCIREAKSAKATEVGFIRSLFYQIQM